MPRATATETLERVEHLQGMILEGQPNTACLTFARQAWGVSRAQGYRLLKKAWEQIKDDCLVGLEYRLEHVPDQLLREILWRSDFVGAKPSPVLGDSQALLGPQLGSSSSDSTS